MNEIETSTPSYPMLTLIVRHGGSASIVIALAIGLACVFLGLRLDSAWLALAGVCVGAVGFVVVRTLVELVRLVTDMLLPK